MESISYTANEDDFLEMEGVLEAMGASLTADNFFCFLKLLSCYFPVNFLCFFRVKK